MKINLFKNILVVFFLLHLSLVVSCGADNNVLEDDENTTDQDQQENNGATPTDPDPILTEKLVGTPFEGLTTGDDLTWCTFLSGDYLTPTADEFPISVFLALFTQSEEQEIKEGVTIANDALGFEGLVVTDTWTPMVRVIYKVDVIAGMPSIDEYLRDMAGHTQNIYYQFNGHSYSETVVPDWSIELTEEGIKDKVVAHELGHAFGIQLHALIDYENDIWTELEENSVMDSYVHENPVYSDYNYMMQTQGVIYQEHLGETAPNGSGPCVEY